MMLNFALKTIGTEFQALCGMYFQIVFLRKTI